MVNTFIVKDAISDKSFDLPVGIPQELAGIFSITFYSDANYTTPVNPTGGTATFKISEDEFNYGTIDNGTITFPVSDSYNRPSFTGYCSHAKVTLDGIQGAAHFMARIHLGE